MQCEALWGRHGRRGQITLVSEVRLLACETIRTDWERRLGHVKGLGKAA